MKYPFDVDEVILWLGELAQTSLMTDVLAAVVVILNYLKRRFMQQFCVFGHQLMCIVSLKKNSIIVRHQYKTIISKAELKLEGWITWKQN